MKLWIDDRRPAPEGYVWLTTCTDTIKVIINSYDKIELLDLDHDSGSIGFDYIHILNWAEETYGSDFSIPIHIHSMNAVGVENMRRIIRRNGWTEVK